MMLTETEAGSRWCPFSRCLTTGEKGTNGVALTAINRGLNGEVGGPATACVASSCMAWRFAREEVRAPNLNQFPADRGEYRQSDKGYCGLAGSGWL
jgi:hypothetical protein